MAVAMPIIPPPTMSASVLMSMLSGSERLIARSSGRGAGL
jgi:hypothetical protein